MENEKEYRGIRANGFVALFINVLILGGIIFSFIRAGNPYYNEVAYVILIVCLSLLHIFIWTGFIIIEPNQARVMVLFGKYVGSIKTNGFYFVNPLLSKKKISQRALNLDVEPIKVNDKGGNPIMIGLVLVWRVSNTYKALFDIEIESNTQFNQGAKQKALREFVRVQSDAALRKLAGMYSYDSEEDGAHTLRGGSDEINERLEKELAERLEIAGIEILEARINYLAYAQEIAGAMLRRQQAQAIIAAREKIVEGAVSMVQMALHKLSEGKVVELDEDKKAAMVSNLMVVLCSENNTQPVVNAGTLHS